MRSVAFKARTFAWLLVLFVVAHLVYFWGATNADWKGYALIFESGAWLRDQGRDLVFLGLVEAFKSVVSADYHSFRSAFAAYFTISLVWLLRRWQKTSLPAAATFPYSTISVLPLVLPRFTVQIREGFAVTLVLAAFTLLAHTSKQRTSPVLPVFAIPLLLLACFVHAASSIFLAVVLVTGTSLVAGRLLRVPYRHVLAFSSVAAGLLVAWAYNSGQLTALLTRTGSAFYGADISESADTGAQKALYWGLHTLVVAYIISRVRTLLAGNRDTGFYVASLAYAAFIVLPACELAVLFLIWGHYPAILASGAIRLYRLVLDTLVFITAMEVSQNASVSRRGEWRLLCVVVLFLLTDEYRVLLTAVAT
jgi:hypothetical protein